MNHELIDTWWDVNFSNSSSTQPLAAELIDTWWDVNFSNSSSTQPLAAELIDTWWDVNYTIPTGARAVIRINRYIVGCK